ncbi:uncharacterized protein LOC123292633 [Chrysoperla carnea]|uniref:uncharacterized protein LOC123292633 n=1 Tax=Chrysoperla carnea TaxID=189513 RepID=UPI001D096AE0|nr:uncharacterized protein LOC123292633 [Chrysoperla carnea]
MEYPRPVYDVIRHAALRHLTRVQIFGKLENKPCEFFERTKARILELQTKAFEQNFAHNKWCLIFFIPLLIVNVQTDEVIVDNNNEDETLLVSDSKPKNDFLVNEHKWRAIDEVRGGDHAIEDLTVPYDANHSEITVTQGERYDQPKRRRTVRKRKRRPYPPPISSDYNDHDDNDRILKPRRLPLREQEHYLDDHWQGAAFAAEQLTHKRPYHKRRRQNPVYEEDENDEFIRRDEENAYRDTKDEENITYDLPKHENSDAQRRHETRFNEQTESNNEEKVNFKPKSYRKPYSTHKNTEDEPDNGTNLKSLLKQSGGSLSLVEILQQRNLSLADFLKEKENAISLLKNPPILDRVDNNEKEETELPNRKLQPQNFHGESEMSPLGEVYSTNEKDNNRFSNTISRRLPPARLPKVRTEDATVRNVRKEQSAMKEHMNAQRKRLSSLRTEKDNRIFGEIKHFDVVTEATTEKRIFIPSKYNNENLDSTSMSTTRFQPSTSRFTTTSTTTTTEPPTKAAEITSSTSTTTPTTSTIHVNPDLIIKGNGMAVTRNRLALKPRLKIPIFENVKTKPPQLSTSTTKKPIETTEIPKNAFAIDIKELVGINKFIKEIKSTELTESEKDEPLKISMNINEMLNKSEQINSTPKTNNLISNTNDYTDNIITDYTSTYKSPSAKDEIMEILKDNNIRVRLAKVLAVRNMTFAELVALRERGSSHVHLADIFHSQSKEPSPIEKETIEINNDGKKSEEKLSSFRLNPLTKDDSENYYTPLIKITPPKSINREARNHKFFKINNPDYSTVIDLLNQQNVENLPPQWNKNTHSDISYLTENIPNPIKNYQKMLKHEERIEAIENSIVATSDTTQNNYNYADKHIFDDEDDYMQLPSGVRSAIVASFAIIASSIFIFMTIFIIFKWQQKKRRRLRYNSSISTMKGRLPILQKSKRKNGTKDVNPIMVNVTSNSKNVLYNNNGETNNNANSEEYLWDSLRKPFH